MVKDVLKPVLRKTLLDPGWWGNLLPAGCLVLLLAYVNLPLWLRYPAYAVLVLFVLGIALNLGVRVWAAHGATWRSRAAAERGWDVRSSSVSDEPWLPPGCALLVRVGYVHAAGAFIAWIPLVFWLLNQAFPLVPNPWVTLACLALFAVQVMCNLSPRVRYAVFAVFLLVTAMDIVPVLRAATESHPGTVVPATVLWTALAVGGAAWAAWTTLNLVANRTARAVVATVIVIDALWIGSAGIVTYLAGFAPWEVFVTVMFVSSPALIPTITLLASLFPLSHPLKAALYLFFAVQMMLRYSLHPIPESLVLSQ